MNTVLQTLELNPPGDKPRGSLIILHGLGADGQDFLPLVAHFDIHESEHIRFVCPNAPSRPITVNQGMVMPAWYDIYSLSFIRREDETGIQASQRMLHQLIEKEEARGIPSEHIFLMGFSQGAAMALYAGLSYPRPLSAILALSGYLPLPKPEQAQRHSANQQTPIWIGHGVFDPVVPFHLGEQAYAQLQTAGYAVQFHRYNMAHSIELPEIQDIKQFLHDRIGTWKKTNA